MQKGRYKSTRAKFLERDTVRRLLEGPRAAKAARDYYLLACAYYLALRVGEVVVLRRTHFDWDDRVVWIPSLKRKPKRHHRLDGLTGRPLLAVPILFGDRVLRGAYRWAAHRRWLFPGAKDGMPLTTRQAGEVFKQWSAAAGVKRDVSIHALRHAAAATVYEVTDDVTLIRDYLRHSSIRTTDTYLHSTPKQVDRVRAALRGRR